MTAPPAGLRARLDAAPVDCRPALLEARQRELRAGIDATLDRLRRSIEWAR